MVFQCISVTVNHTRTFQMFILTSTQRFIELLLVVVMWRTVHRARKIDARNPAAKVWLAFLIPVNCHLPRVRHTGIHLP